MDSLVLSNILFRKTRTLVSIAGVALGVILVVLTVGIVNGFLHEQGRRNSAVTAEIMFHPGGEFSLGVSNTPQLKMELVDELRQIEGVAEAVPVASTTCAPGFASTISSTISRKPLPGTAPKT